MASPSTITIHDLTGVFVMNKTLSDPFDSILQLQHISWFMRKAISLATITLTIEQYTAPSTPDSPSPPLTHIDVQQRATGGLSGTTENRVLDWEVREHVDHVFGKLAGQSRFVTLPDDKESLMDEYLGEGWLAEDTDGDAKEDKPAAPKKILVQAFADAVNSDWTAEQTWGFDIIEGKRFYVRRVVCRSKKGAVEKARLVYDYQGPKLEM